MPKLTKATPKYRKDRASGQAVVVLDGHKFYLGPHNTKASRREYDRLVGEWLANGRHLPGDGDDDDITIVELLVLYRRHAKLHYRKNGKLTRSLDNIDAALRPLRHFYGRQPVRDFGPVKLRAVRDHMIRGYADSNGKEHKGLSRKVINGRIGAIKRAFRWAVSMELAPRDLVHALDAVPGLQQGRTEARETSPVKPIDDTTVDATLPHLPAVVADMVRFQRLTGCRPGEVCSLRPMDLDRSGDVWLFRPESHKTEHHGRDRIIFVGPQAQAVLMPYLLRPKAAHCFSPADSERQRHADQRAARRTPVQPSQQNRRTAKRQRAPRAAYDKNAYRKAIARACTKAGVTSWSPNRLRHTAATSIRRKFGLEAAQVLLGHSRADVTQVYAERDSELGRRVAKAAG